MRMERPMTVEDKVVEVICEVISVKRELVTREANMINDLGVDSLDIIELTMDIEEEFGIDIPDEDIENMKIVGDICEYLEKRNV